MSYLINLNHLGVTTLSHGIKTCKISSRQWIGRMEPIQIKQMTQPLHRGSFSLQLGFSWWHIYFYPSRWHVRISIQTGCAIFLREDRSSLMLWEGDFFLIWWVCRWFLYVEEWIICTWHGTWEALLHLVARWHMYDIKRNRPCREDHLLHFIFVMLVSNEDTRSLWDLGWWAIL